MRLSASIVSRFLPRLSSSHSTWRASRPAWFRAAMARSSGIRHDGLDGALIPDHALILRLDRPEQRSMDEPEVVAVAVVLGQHLPVGGAAMLHPPRGQHDLALGRQVAGTIDQRHGLAEMFLERDAVQAQAREH